MATPLVSTMASPGRAPEVVTTSSLAASPSMEPTAMGRGRSYVTSVWPPTRVTPISPQAAATWSKMDSTAVASVCSGRSRVTMNQRGSAPITARSLALIWTTYQPIRSVAKVMGSVLVTR